MKRSFATRVLPLFGALLMATGIAAAQQEDRALTSVPAGAVAYVSADVQKLRAFWNQIKDSAVGKFLAKELGDKAGKSGAAEVGPMLEMLGQAFAGPISIALVDDQIQPGRIPALVAIAPTKGQQEAQTIVMFLQMRLQADKRFHVATRDYQGTTITTITGEKLKGIQPSYALVADRLLVATQPTWLEKALDASAEKAPRLADDPKVQRVRALLAAKAGAPAWFWMDSARLGAMMMKASEEAAKAPKAGQDSPAAVVPDALPQPGAPAKPKGLPFKQDALKPFLDAYASAGGVLELTPQGIAVETVTLVNGGSDLGKKILAQRGGALRSAQLTSANAILYVGFNNIPFIVDAMRTFAGAVEGNAQQMLAGIGQTIQSATGLDPKTDILDNLGSEAAVALNDLPADLKSIPALIYVEAKQPHETRMGKTMQKLRARAGEAMGIKFLEKPMPQGRIYHMAADSMPIPIAPGWTFASDFLVIGATPDALKSPLFLSKGTGSALSATPAYQKAVGASGDRLLGVAYINLAKVAAFADKLPSPKGKDGKPAVDPEAVKALMQALRTLTAMYGIQDDVLVSRMDLGLDLAK